MNTSQAILQSSNNKIQPSCDICGINFKSKHGLITHKRVHTLIVMFVTRVFHKMVI